MDDEPGLAPETFAALATAFSAALPQPAGVHLDDVRQFLIEQIVVLLERNPALLLSILYRVDVAERDVRRVFAECPPDEIPPRLAGLLIERQLQKLRTRRHRES